MKALLFSYLLAFLVTCASANPAELEKTYQKLVQGSVPPITPAELIKEIKKKPIVLLDTRETPEFLVSHLPDARYAGYEKFSIKPFLKMDRSTPIVVYCSIGYRSERIGEKLQRAGFSEVRNLAGGIFAWANLGLPLHGTNGKPVKAVHGYDEEWAKFLSARVQTVLK